MPTLDFILPPANFSSCDFSAKILSDKEKDDEEQEFEYIPIKLDGDEVPVLNEQGLRRSWGSIMSLLSLMASD